MNRLLIVSLSVLVAGALAVDDKACLPEFTTFAQCSVDSLNKAGVTGDNLKAAAKDQVAQCFTQQQCEPPKPGDANGDKMKDMMGQMPDTVKKCIKRKLVVKLGSQLNDCLKKQGVNNVNFTLLADLPDNFGEGDDQGMSENIMAKMDVIKALRACVDKKGGSTDAVKPVDVCMHNLKKTAKPKVCSALKPCASKLTKDCLSRGEDLRHGFCVCKQQKLKEVVGKADALLKDNSEKYTISQLMSAVISEQDSNDILNVINQCYDENKEKKPMALTLAAALMQNKGGKNSAASKMNITVDRKTVIVVRDLLDVESSDKTDCDKCQ